jgi:N-methylhydantoinase B
MIGKKKMSSIDAVRLGLIWQRLNGMADEVAESFIRSSFSSVVRENSDMAFSLLDTQGRQFIQTRRSIPSFIGTLPRTLRAILAEFPLDTLNEGDVVISNDAWLGTGHLNDITMVHPIFHKGRVVAFAGSTAHTADIGGAPSPTAKDCFEEGLCIPICKIMERGVENRTVLSFLQQNLREPDETLGDIRAQFAAYKVASEKLFQLLEDEGLNDLDQIIEEILDRSEISMRHKISEIPDGDYSDVMTVDGFDHPLTIKCKVTVDGETIVVDFDGTSPQINRPINAVLNYTYAYACYALKCALDPSAPNNEGSFRPITIKAPEGSILNAKRPAPVWGRHLSGHYVPPAIYAALSIPLPTRIIAESGSPLWNIYFKGTDAETGKQYVKMFFMNGGHGARPHGDGPGCLSFPSNVSNQSIEQFENQVPLIVTEKAFVPDTCGIGRDRGGPAQRLSFHSVGDGEITMTIRHERVKFPPRGLLGGGNGSAGKDMVNGKNIPAKAQIVLEPGDTATFVTPSGGGMYSASERDADMVSADVLSGILTPEAATEIYGYTAATTEKSN